MLRKFFPYCFPKWNFVNAHRRETVALHNKEDDLWVIINGKVYDLTNFASIHPGGRQILIQNAGTDATDYFNNIAKHSESSSVQKYMKKYYIGELMIDLSAIDRFTRAEVAKHNVPEDLWIIVNGHVYDMTEFLQVHPGGREVLLKVAGQDASKSFKEISKHMQNEKVDQYMKKYFIGTILDRYFQMTNIS